MIVVTKILTHTPDVEKSYKMMRNDFSDFRLGFYGQTSVRNVPAGFYSAFSYELRSAEHCWPTKNHRKAHIGSST